MKQVIPAEEDATARGIARNSVVSFDSEMLILVDANDVEIGFMSKAEAHRGHGHLHRAFSVFIFDEQGRVLVQQRAASKRLWPSYWSNACCSHPRQNEAIEAAVNRRLEEELGIRCQLDFLFKFKYQAQFDVDGAENEMCSVFTGRSGESPQFNRREISAVRYLHPSALDREVEAADGKFTPWFLQEWSRIRTMDFHLPHDPVSMASGD